MKENHVTQPRRGGFILIEVLHFHLLKLDAFITFEDWLRH
jgi:hypothetical protein